MLPLLVILAMAVAGFMILRRGIRGSPIDDHPWCIRCRFDLVGRPRDFPRCPECGASLNHVGAVAWGRRRRSPRLIWSGSLLLLFSVGLVIVAELGRQRQIDWSAYEPTWMLQLELAHGTSQRQANAARVLISRARAGALSESQAAKAVQAAQKGLDASAPVDSICAEVIASLAEGGALAESSRSGLFQWILTRQQDRSRSFPARLGSVMETAFYNGELSDSDFAQFLRHSCRPSLRIPAGPFEPGQEVPVSLSWDWRGGSGPLEFQVSLPGLARRRYDINAGGWFGGPASYSQEPVGWLRANVSPGSHEITGSVTLSLGQQYINRGLAVSYPVLKNAKRSLATLPVLSATFDLRFPYKVAPTSADEREQLSRRIRSMFLIGDSARETYGDGPSMPLSLTVCPFAKNLRLKFTATWQYDDREVKVVEGSVHFSTEGSGHELRNWNWSSSGSNSTGQERDERFSLSLPIRKGGPDSGALLLSIESIEIDGRQVEVRMPLTCELPVSPVPR